MVKTPNTKTDVTQSLQEFLEPSFSASDRQRGTELWLDGGVDVHRGDDRKVEARVKGAPTREVSLWSEDGDLCFSCPCDVASSSPCAHLYAVIREVGMLGLLRGVRRDASVQLRAIPVAKVAAREATSRATLAESPSGALGGDEGSLPDWKSRLTEVETALGDNRVAAASNGATAWPRHRQLLYLIDVDASREDGSLVLRLARRERKSDGAYGRARIADLSAAEQEGITDIRDRHALEGLRGVVARGSGTRAVLGAFVAFHNPLVLPPAIQRSVGPFLCATGRCYALRSGGEVGSRPLRFEEGVYAPRLRVTRADDGGWLLRGELARGSDRIEVSEPAFFTEVLFLHDSRLAPIGDTDGMEWMVALRRSGPIQVPASEGVALVERLLQIPRLPRLLLPSELKVEEVRPVPRPNLRLEDPPDRQLLEAPLVAEVSFNYDGWIVSAGSGEQRRFQPDAKRVVVRDGAAEQQSLELLEQLGVDEDFDADEPVFELAKGEMMRVVRELLALDWSVEVGGRIVRPPIRLVPEIRSNNDWFELLGEVEYGGNTEASLPDILKAVRRGQETITLSDGSVGLVPPSWRKRYGLLSGLGVQSDQGLRFDRRRVAVLDAVLADELELTFDQAYQRARDRLRRFSGVPAADPPETFLGSLRPYQREALGWFRFLSDFGFGGCLADDMGLGKTVQVLALLETRRAMGEANGAPTLVIAPRSLLFNWAQEAEKFAPQLTVLQLQGKDRPRDPSEIRADVVLTTYGIMVRDLELLQQIEFDYVVLDEAQTIKNRGTRTSKAALALRGRNRLALTGTPLENHVGEMFNLFEFLNPGLLGSVALQRKVGLHNNPPDEEEIATMRGLFRPFLLRRTKQEVAKDLPRKTEQVLAIDLSEDERLAYDEIHHYYRGELLERIRRDGMQKSRMHVLEGLLRMRQAACHAGLLDVERQHERGAKLEFLLSRLHELIREGHKAVVFSQFTTFLAIIRGHLEREGIAYSYLDGQTNDRQREVKRFQEDPKIGVFLISIKAGGVGLNLTSADYVFLLDPWWNPAIEAQAIDRAYRIGQKRPVFAYRLIARDTVEERVLAMQRDKRDLSDALLDQSGGGATELNRADIESLLT